MKNTEITGSFLGWLWPFGAAVAKAAAARLMPHSADNGLPLPIFWNKPTAIKPSTTNDLPLHHSRTCSMRSMRSMRGGIIFRNRGPSLKVHVFWMHASTSQCSVCATTSVVFVPRCLWSPMLFVHVYIFPYLSRVFSTHTSVRLCFFLSYTAPFDTLYWLVIAFAS